jgi:sulfatase maturation enzyme AslB (radical SAM superfamily)
MIELSSVCNARCGFCTHHNMPRAKRIMDDGLFELIVNRIHEEQIQPTLIDLFAVGEPLADHALPQRIERLKAEFPQTPVRIISNFALANQKVIDDLLLAGLDRIQISLNAASKDAHRSIMGLDYEKTVLNIEKLLERRSALGKNLLVALSFVICDQNRDEVKEFKARWSRKVDRIIFQRMVDWGGAINIKDPYRDAPYPCHELFERIAILSNGEYALCCQDHLGIVEANVRVTPILEAFSSEYFENIRRVHLDGDPALVRMCENCMGIHSSGTNWLLLPAPLL